MDYYYITLSLLSLLFLFIFIFIFKFYKSKNANFKIYQNIFLGILIAIFFSFLISLIFANFLAISKGSWENFTSKKTVFLALWFGFSIINIILGILVSFYFSKKNGYFK